MYLGIDLGTSSVKVVILDAAMQLVAQASQPLTVSRPQPLWSEQDPDAWWQATNAAMAELDVNLLQQVKGIGLSGQQHGAVLLGKKGNVLRPAILWNDGRSGPQCDLLLKRVPQAHEITGNLIMPGFTAPKILWVQAHEPEIAAQIDKVLLPKDYLRYCMSGDFASDLSDSSGTSWLKIAKRAWSSEMLAACELTEANMPKLYEGNEVTGVVTPDIAKQWGIPADTPIAGGAGDNAAGAISVNVIQPGRALLSLGTSGVYFVSSDSFNSNPQGGVHNFTHCLPGLWHEMNCHLSAASCLDWYAKQANSSVSDLLAQVENDNHLSPIIFLPYLSGERSPLNNPYACGMFFGLRDTTSQADMMRAVLEGVAFNFANGQDQLLKAGVTIGDVSVVGGGARSLYWGKILATALQRPLSYRVNREVGAAIGAARLAYLAVTKADPHTAFVDDAVEMTIDPVAEWQQAYAEKQKLFNALYANTQDLMNQTFSKE